MTCQHCPEWAIALFMWTPEAMVGLSNGPAQALLCRHCIPRHFLSLPPEAWAHSMTVRVVYV